MAERRYPRYRLLTGLDDDHFCYRVSEALDLGYELYGGPAMTNKGGASYVAQAVIWSAEVEPPIRPDVLDSSHAAPFDS